MGILDKMASISATMHGDNSEEYVAPTAEEAPAEEEDFTTGIAGAVNVMHGDNTESYTSPVPAPPAKKVKQTILDYSRDEVSQGLDDGRFAEEEVNRYIAMKKFEEGGLHNLDPESVEYLWNDGTLKDEDVQDYVDKRDNPKFYYFKDTLRGAARGLQNVVKPLLDTVMQASIVEAKAADMAAGVEVPEGPLYEPEAKLPEVVGPTKTALGKVVEVGVEFGLPFAGGVKAMKAISATANLMKTGPMLALAEKAPGLAGYLQSSLDYIVGGAVADFAQNPEQKSKLSDFLAEHELLPGFVSWMSTKEDNPAFVERLKGVLEGIGVGAAFDATVKLLRVAKAATWTRRFVDEDEVNRLTADLLKSQEKRLTDLGISRQDALELIGTKQGERLFPHETGTLPKPGDAEFLKKLAEAADHADAEDVIQTIFRDADRAIAEARGPAKTMQDLTQAGRVLEEKVATGGVDEALSEFSKATRLPMDVARERILGWMGKSVTLENAGAKIVAMKEFVSGQVRAAAEAAEKALLPTASFADMCEAYAHARFGGELLTKLFGVRAEVGRALGAFRREAGGGRFHYDKAPLEELKNLESLSRGEIKGALEAFVKAHKDGKGLEAARHIDRLKGLKGALQFVQSNLLWNWQTQAVNVLSNTAIALEGLSTKLAGGIASGNLDVALKGFKGWWYGAQEALRVSDFLKSGDYKDLGAVYRAMWENRGILDPKAMKEVLPIEQTQGWRQSLWNLVTGFGANFRLMGAADEFFKQTSYWSSIFEDAATIAKLEGKKFGDVLAKEMRELSPEIHQRAWDRAREATLTEGFRPGSTVAKANDLLSNTSGGLVFRILAMPFFQVTANLGRWTGRRTPLGFMSKRVQEDLAAGGLRRAQAISGIIGGTSVLGVGIGLAAAGKINGSMPSKEKEAWANEGRQPDSILIGKVWHKFDRFDPAGMMFSLAANLWNLTKLTAESVMAPAEEAHLHKSLEELAALALSAVTDPTLNKSFMQSSKQFVDAIMDPERSGARLLAGTLEKFVPMGSLSSNYAGNEHVTEFFDLMDSVYKKIDPTKLVDKRNTVTGKRLKDESVPMSKGLQASEDPVMHELAALGVSPKPFPKTITRTRKKGAIEVQGELDREEYERLWDIYEQGVGQQAHEELKKTIEDQRYQRITDPGIKRRILLATISKGRKAAVQTFLAEGPAVTAKMKQEFERQSAALRGLYLTDEGDYKAKNDAWNILKGDATADTSDRDWGLLPD